MNLNDIRSYIKRIKYKLKECDRELIKKNEDLILVRNNLIRERDNLIGERDNLINGLQENYLARENDSIPSILFNTLPKSASVFILETLSKALKKPAFAISPGYFPQDLVDSRLVSKLIAVNGISQSHLDVSEFNQIFFKKIKKIILHLRDPRQATLSWIHHLDRLNLENQYDLIDTVIPTLPDNYFNYDLNDKIDYQLEFYFPQVLTWISNWLDYVNESKEQGHIIITTYESFVLNQTEYFSEIFEFLGCDLHSDILIPEVIPTRDKNYRLGKTDEWLTILSDRQKQSASSKIPQKMKEQFDWK